MIIYKITNLINDKVYVGQTIRNLSSRWKEHSLYSDDCVALSSAIKKYGRDNFIIEEIDGANSLSELNYLEQHHIYINNSLAPFGYNLQTGGKNKRSSDETCEKQSKAMTGKKHSEETKKKMSTSGLGRKLNPRSEEYKKKLSIAATGRIFSEETKRKMTKNRTGKKRGPYNKVINN